jgi:hypothetical protein
MPRPSTMRAKCFSHFRPVCGIGPLKGVLPEKEVKDDGRLLIKLFGMALPGCFRVLVLIQSFTTEEVGCSMVLSR